MRVEQNVKRLRPASQPNTTHTVRFPAAVFFRKETTMRNFLTILIMASTAMGSATEPADWWNPQWQFPTTVERPAPYRDGALRPVEVAVDFARLLSEAGLAGVFRPKNALSAAYQSGSALAGRCRTPRRDHRPQNPL